MLERAAEIARKNQKARSAQPGLTVKTTVKCVMPDAELAAAAEREKTRERREKADKLVAGAGIPLRYTSATLSRLDLSRLPADVGGPYLAAAERIIRLGQAGGILALLGPCGIGKTWLAAGLVLDFCNAGRAAQYLHAFDYLQGLRQTYARAAAVSEGRYESNYLRPELLVIDEIEERGATEWEDRMLRRLIVKRQDNRCATLLLSNVQTEDFKQRIGGKVLSRMQEDAGGIHECAWSNLRGGDANGRSNRPGTRAEQD